MARFFDAEKEMAQARFRSDILTSELTGKIDLVDGWISLGKSQPEISQKLRIIKNEIEKLDAEKVMTEFQYTGDLVPGKFSHEIAEQAKMHLSRLKSYYNHMYQKTKDEKDRSINRINRERGDSFLYEEKMKYHNKSLETLALNTESGVIYHETSCGIMQKIAPIYKSPDFHNGRAHFLASQKNLFGISIGTLSFNLTIIWLMCIFLYIALYFDWLRKIVSFSPKLHFKK
jgi:hypothetical protein